MFGPSVQLVLWWMFASSVSAGIGTFEKPLVSGDERIVGGKPSKPNKYPFMVHLRIEDRNGEGLCGGSLINAQYVLTAAHCLRFKNGAEVLAVTASLGHHNIMNRVENWTVNIKVEKWFYHKYDYKMMNNDVALLKLETPVEFNEAIKPICLPPFGHYYTHGIVRALGWGATDDNNYDVSDELREADLMVLADSDCQKIYRSWYHSKNMICAGHLDGTKDTCTGDSGGPVFIYDDNQVPTLVGLTSFANRGCGRPGLLAVYTRLATYTNWIVAKAALGGPICFGDFNSAE